MSCPIDDRTLTGDDAPRWYLGLPESHAVSIHATMSVELDLGQRIGEPLGVDITGERFDVTKDYCT